MKNIVSANVMSPTLASPRAHISSAAPRIAGLDQHQHAALHAAVERAAHPRAARAMAPLADDAGEQHFFALFGAERLDDGVAAHGVGQRAAHARVPCIGEARGGRDEAERQHGTVTAI